MGRRNPLLGNKAGAEPPRAEPPRAEGVGRGAGGPATGSAPAPVPLT
ncbi:hypothetical protein [Streptomyces arenae]|nr:hypothetical protein [Streptomyces arenae]MCG7209587.1 hypothetical protein [Streptomyces arenae]